MKKILVISPHQDDDVIGCGGLLTKISSKNNLVVVNYYKCDDNEEAKSGSKILGVKKNIFLDIQPRSNNPHTDSIDKLKKIFNKEKPEVVIIPNEDSDEDHNKCSRTSKETIFLSELCLGQGPKLVLGYSVWSEIDKPNLFINIGSSLENKIDALKKHDSQLKTFDYISMVESRAKIYGLLSGNDFAEAYTIYKLDETIISKIF